jgi:hypothetical protein
MTDTNEPPTHSILVDAAGVLKTTCVDYSGLAKLRSMSVPISRVGRQRSMFIDFEKYSVDDYAMRQKAQTLQYTKNQNTLTKKQQYGNITQSKGGSYFFSSRDVSQRIVSNLICPSLDLSVTPPTNSGVHDYKFPGYYLDNNVPLIPSLNKLNA